MIVTLAGHVDHGKSALVRALTGVNTDRLQEERARGLTIDLGFAYATLEGHRIGFVDVPGHHRFIHNMIAGVGRNQHALLVVAADDGVMPQTIEHLQILSLLGLRTGTIVINKSDRVDRERLEKVHQEIQVLVKGSFLSEEKPIEVSATTGLGIDRLREQITERASLHRIENRRRAAFRMAIDRAFSLSGAGTVVTGTVIAGTISRQDVVTLSRSMKQVRIRSLHAQNEPADTAGSGDRVGLNLVGVPATGICRGDWLVAPQTALGAHTATIAFEVLGDYPRAISRWLPIHLYHLTSRTEARISTVGNHPIAPGTTGLVDALLQEELQLKVGDSVIARTFNLNHTIGGGEVVSLGLWPRRRNSPARQELLARLVEAVKAFDPAAALSISSSHTPIDLDSFGREWNLLPPQLDEVVAEAEVCVLGKRVLRKETAERTLNTALSLLSQFHKRHPERDGCSLGQMHSLLGLSGQTTEFVLGHGVSIEKLRLSGGNFALPEFRSQVPTYDLKLFYKIRECVDTPNPLSTGDIAKRLQIPLPVLVRNMLPMLREGVLVQIAQHRVLTPARIAKLYELAQEIGVCEPFSVAEFRSTSGLGRNTSVQFLEYLDRKGITRRVGNAREILRYGQESL